MPLLSKNLKFFIAIFAQILFILLIVIFKLAGLNSGTTVYLKLAPVDPRDPLRGDYLNLRYDISTVYTYTSGETISNGDIVYVPLNKSGMFWESAYNGVTKNKPTEDLTNNYIYIKGTVKSGGEASMYSQDYDYGYKNYSYGPWQIAYNIESYFIPEGAGTNAWDLDPARNCFGNSKCLEDASLPQNQPFAEVAIDDNHNAILKQIYVNGKPWPQGGKKLELTDDKSDWGPEATPTPISKQITVPTASTDPALSTYINPKYGFYFNYPIKMALSSNNDDVSNFQTVTLSSSNYQTEYVQVYSSPNTYGYSNISDYTESIYLKPDVISYSTLNINGHEAAQVVNKYNTTVTFIFNTDKTQIYTIMQWTKDKPTDEDKANYDTIVNSFNY